MDQLKGWTFIFSKFLLLRDSCPSNMMEEQERKRREGLNMMADAD